MKSTLLETLFKDTDIKGDDLVPCLHDGEAMAIGYRGPSGPHVLFDPNVHPLLAITTYLFLLLLCL